MLDLAEHHQGGDTQRYGDGELDHHQGGAQPAAAAAGPTAAAQHRGRTEPRQHQGGIGPAEQARQDRRGQGQGQDRPIAQVAEADRPLQKGVETGQQHLGHGQGQDQRHQSDQHRFAQELGDQLDAAGAQGLAHADLARPKHGLGGGQVGEVEAGDQHDQHADGGHAIDRRPAARRRDRVRIVRCVQVHAPERRQMHPIDVAPRGLDVDLDQLGADIAVENRIELRQRPARIHARRQADIGVGAVLQPVLAVGLQEGVGYGGVGDDEVGRQLTVVRYVVEHAGDGQGDGVGRAGAGVRRARPVHGHDLAQRIGLAEIFAGHGLRQQHRLRLRQSARPIARDQGQAQQAQKVRIDRADGLGELLGAVGEGHVLGVEAGETGHARNLVAHRRRQLERDVGLVPRRAAGRDHGQFELIEIVRARQPAVVGQLVAHEQDDEDRAGQGHGQAGDGDDAVEPVAHQVAQRHGEIIA